MASKERATARWSVGLETLSVDISDRPENQHHFDLVIVGSGYGGSVAAEAFARMLKADGTAFRVCLLERGEEHLPGSFPTRMSELPSHVRFNTHQSPSPVGQRTGLWDLRMGPDLNVLLGNGLGGGSLINAGVMLEPAEQSVRDALFAADSGKWGALDFNEARRKVGVLAADVDGREKWNRVDFHTFAPGQNGFDGGFPIKYEALGALRRHAGPHAAFGAVPITVALEDDAIPDPETGIQMKKCVGCGDCATGCNFSAKKSLDTNLLPRAAQRGVRIVTGATVLKLERQRDRPAAGTSQGWELEVVHTDADLRKRERYPLKLRAERVILAAGSLGSPEILLRSQTDSLRFSTQLGRKFSGNGDSVISIYKQSKPVGAIVDETIAPDTRGVGPIITGMLDLREEPDPRAPGGKKGIIVQEMSIPGALRRLLEESVTTANALAGLGRPDLSAHDPAMKGLDPLAVDAQAIDHTQVLAVIGLDTAEGTLELVGGDESHHGDGAIRVRWPGVRDGEHFDRQLDYLKQLTPDLKRDGTVLPSPLWRPLPPELEYIFGPTPRGAAFTAHPLGGCGIGATLESGAVDPCGRVYDRDATNPANPYHEGLVVLDGSIVPGALGVNPSLTITALALRATKALTKEWALAPGSTQRVNPKPVPNFADMLRRDPPKPTEIELIERMSGPIALRTQDGGVMECVVEWTLRFKPKAVRELMSTMRRELVVADNAVAPSDAICSEPIRSELRVFRQATWDQLRHDGAQSAKYDEAVIFTAPLKGAMRLLHREASDAPTRRRRANVAWRWNRKWRDVIQELAQRYAERRLFTRQTIDDMFDRAASSEALKTHAGEVRVIEYDLALAGPAVAGPAATDRDLFNRLEVEKYFKADARLSGVKRLAYTKRSNPLNQLREVTLETFPAPSTIDSARLKLDTRYLADIGVPLIRVVGQQDQVSALADLVSFGLYFVRVILSIHVWTLRLPDRSVPNEPQRLPGELPNWLERSTHPIARFTSRVARVFHAGMPKPIIKELELGHTPQGTPIRVRLTRYKRSGAQPVVLIHGYSASGTTFAHPAVRPNLAQTLFHDARRDVWVLDLRTSSGMPTARLPWKFEDAALEDIPAAFDEIRRTLLGERRQEKTAPAHLQEPPQLEVFAHCMGSAMFSMAVLKPARPDEPFARERNELPAWIKSAVLSQVGPSVVFSPDNVFRAFLMRYILQYLPFDQYTFRIDTEPSMLDQIFDRALAVLPYPESEFELENPPPYLFWRRTPWVRTRHRMDFLYGQDFELAPMPRRVLRHIDDLFGPLSLETVAQGIHFARFNSITDRAGRDVFATPENIKNRWNFPTMSVHGELNGLAHVSTLEAMRALMASGQKQHLFTTREIRGCGHQDGLIGRNAPLMFPSVLDFFDTCDTRDDRRDEPRDDQRVDAIERFDVPWAGPNLGATAAPNSYCVSAQAHPGRGAAKSILVVPVTLAQDAAGRRRFERVDASPLEFGAFPTLDDGWFTFQSDATNGGCLRLLLLDHQVDLAQALGTPAPMVDAARTLWGPPRGEVALQVLDPAIARDTDATSFLHSLDLYLQQTPRSKLEQGLVVLPAIAPSPDRSTIRFALGSCQYPAGVADKHVAYQSLERLAARVVAPRAASTAPELLLLLGDQVYLDATGGMFDPRNQDDRFGRPYEDFFRIPALRKITQRIPTYMMLDDHEIGNNWAPAVDDWRRDTGLEDGRRAYIQYQRRHGPPLRSPQGVSTHPLYFDFMHGDFAFFVADTRTERTRRWARGVNSARAISDARARIMSDVQFSALCDWLTSQTAATVKFIASPSMLLPRRLRIGQADGDAIHSDAWDGYSDSLHRMLAFIAKQKVQNVVFLSGDEHISSLAKVRLHVEGNESDAVEVLSIHSSGLYSPLPFANGRMAEFKGPNDEFSFDDPESADAQNPLPQITCTVATTFHPGDGFAIVSVDGPGPNPRIAVEFDRGASSP